MPSLSRLALALVLPLFASCTVYTPAEYRYLEESRTDSTRMNRAAADSAAVPDAATRSRMVGAGSVRSAGERARSFTPAALGGQGQPATQEAATTPVQRTPRSEG